MQWKETSWEDHFGGGMQSIHTLSENVRGIFAIHIKSPFVSFNDDICLRHVISQSKGITSHMAPEKASKMEKPSGFIQNI